MSNNHSTSYNRNIKQNVYWVERDAIGIALYDPLATELNRFTSLSVVRTVTLYYYKKCAHFNTLDSTSSTMGEDCELPEQFHQYIVDKAIQKGYEYKPELIQMAPYFERKFEKGVKEGKMYANRGRISGTRHIRQSSY
jgi:hypothetical protein|tara:strand:- start:182 stop:595 length:414 start_codon:yes stop_codon:yes gene_type:complete